MVSVCYAFDWKSSSKKKHFFLNKYGAIVGKYASVERLQNKWCLEEKETVTVRVLNKLLFMEENVWSTLDLTF